MVGFFANARGASLLQCVRQAPGPTSPAFWRASTCICQGLKRLNREADKSHIFIADIKNKRSHTSIDLMVITETSLLSPVTANPSLLCSSLPPQCCLTIIVQHHLLRRLTFAKLVKKISYIEVRQRLVSSWKQPADSNSNELNIGNQTLVLWDSS